MFISLLVRCIGLVFHEFSGVEYIVYYSRVVLTSEYEVTITLLYSLQNNLAACNNNKPKFNPCCIV